MTRMSDDALQNSNHSIRVKRQNGHIKVPLERVFEFLHTGGGMSSSNMRPELTPDKTRKTPKSKTPNQRKEETTIQPSLSTSNSNNSSSNSVTRWAFLIFIVFITFFAILNFGMHDIINDHGHGPSSHDNRIAALHDIRNYVINEVNYEKKFIVDELSYIGHELVNELESLRGHNHAELEDPIGFIPPDVNKPHDIIDQKKMNLELKLSRGETEGGGQLVPPNSITVSDTGIDKEKDDNVVITVSETNTNSGSSIGSASVNNLASPHPSPPAISITAKAEPTINKLARYEVDHSGRDKLNYKTILNTANHYPHIENRDDISDYIDKGGMLPILMMTCNRAKLLEITLGSLLSVRGISKKQIIVSQDGKQSDVANVVKSHGLNLIQNIPANNKHNKHLRGNYNYLALDGASRIAMHYKFSLTHIFNEFPNAPAVIIVEDDLLFSPDFLEYFINIAPILDIDDTTFVISAWNDNGYKGKVDDPYSLSRTEYFPGLGWLLSKRLYKTELESQWPTSHWDHWLRSFEINKGREIIFPQVPRTFHNGIKGTFMDLSTHNRYFKNINYNENNNIKWATHGINNPYSISVASASASDGGGGSNSAANTDTKSLPPVTYTGVPTYITGTLPVYETRIANLIQDCVHLQNVDELIASISQVEIEIEIDSQKKREQLLQNASILCLWINVDPDPQYGGSPPFQRISDFFGLWHEHRRGAHKGLHEFYWEHGKKYILLLNTFNGQMDRQQHHTSISTSTSTSAGGSVNTPYSYTTYLQYKPKDVTFIQPSAFDNNLKLKLMTLHRQELLKGLGSSSSSSGSSSNGIFVPALDAGMSCNDVCSSHSHSNGNGNSQYQYYCKDDILYLANACSELKKAFGCSGGCSDKGGFGPEQPAYVIPSAPEPTHHPNLCILSSNPAMATCEASHPMTRRLCTCIPK
jgi:hypothetical protein